jgi:pyruvate, water dikinase
LSSEYVRFLEEITKFDVGFAGGKGANLGEVYRSKLPVPHAFVVTTKAYKAFAKAHGLDEKLQRQLRRIDMDDLESLEKGAAAMRKMIETSAIPRELAEEVELAYRQLSRESGQRSVPVAVRSSATMEDLREASFAGQQITLLNVKGARGVLAAIRRCWASAYTARATFYRAKRGFGSHSISTAVVVQKQIMSEKAGVGFTIHPLTGDRTKVVVEAVYGQGEEIVSGRIAPDTFVIDKKTGKVLESKISRKTEMKKASSRGPGLVTVEVPTRLKDRPVLEGRELKALWEVGRTLENHYKYPQDFEWAIEKGRIYLLQTRAVTVIGKKSEGVVEERPILKGLGASPGIGSGQVKLVLGTTDFSRVNKGDVLVTRMTTPDYVPLMVKTSGIVTDEGGMTSHAAIVSRELGVPCVVGTSNATKVLKDGMTVSVDGSNGLVFRGRVTPVAKSAESAERGQAAGRLKTRTKVYMNLGVPEKIKEYSKIPFDGIGLMRVEFIIASYVGEHPQHLVETGREEVFVDRLSEGIATVAREIRPRPLVVRFSDFKTNEYRELAGGERYEDVESNPMIGWRGVSRYVSPEYEEAFRMELRAIKRVRERMGLTNVWVMLPFVRTTWEVEKCLGIMEGEGLKRGEGFKVWLMAEVPSVVFLAEEFARLCDGFSIGSNDLTQLILGIDRDSGRLGRMGYFDERNEAVKRAIKMLVEGAHKAGRTVSVCGQAPSVYPEFTEYLVSLGIDSVSVNPDSVVKTRELVHEVESRARLN